MSLHDIDKNNSNRITPLLNSADDVQQRMAQGTTQIQNSSDPTETDGLRFLERQINIHAGGVDRVKYGFQTDGSLGLSFSDGSNQRMIIGPDSTDTPVIKISQAGSDASTASDDNLIFNSNYNMFKIIRSGTATLSVPTPFNSGATLTVTIPHGQTTVPGFMVWATLPNTGNIPSAFPVSRGFPIPFTSFLTSGGAPVLLLYPSIDSSNLYIDYKNISASNLINLDGTYSFKYFIFQETAN